MEGEGEEEIKGIKARVTIRPVVALATITSTKHVAYYYKKSSHASRLFILSQLRIRLDASLSVEARNIYARALEIFT